MNRGFPTDYNGLADEIQDHKDVYVTLKISPHELDCLLNGIKGHIQMLGRDGTWTYELVLREDYNVLEKERA